MKHIINQALNAVELWNKGQKKSALDLLSPNFISIARDSHSSYYIGYVMARKGFERPLDYKLAIGWTLAQMEK